MDEREELSVYDIVLSGPPGLEGGRFIEVEDGHGRSISAGEWIKRDDGLWMLRLPAPPAGAA
jgi:hypothetical protein